MALVTLTGFPSSGKSTRALELVRALERRIASGSSQQRFTKVVLVSENSLVSSRLVYDDAREEKMARASVQSACVRQLTPGTIVVVDALNYIKGFRYQLYCSAREVQSRTCTVHLAVPPRLAREWNDRRDEHERYARATLDNLIARYEEPSSSVRWDSPLVVVAHDEPALDSSSSLPSRAATTQAKNAAGRDDDYDEERRRAGDDDTGAEENGSDAFERIWAAITSGELKPPNLAVLPQPTTSTTYLSLLERTTSQLVNALLARQRLAPLSGSVPLTLESTCSAKQRGGGGSSAADEQEDDVRVSLQAFKPVSSAQLQRLRRQFTQLERTVAHQQQGKRHTAQGDKEGDRQRIARLFAVYVEANLAAT